MKHEGRGVIRIDDKTDHGGWVISTSSGTIVMGKEAALADDMTYCPTCKGQFSIKPDGKGARHQGRSYAYHGDLTECGAHLITSLIDESLSMNPAHQNINGLGNPTFDDRFVLLDEHTGEPIAFTEYAIEREDGRVEHGITNESGQTHLLSATAVRETIKVYAAISN
jgi:uncharacterized Zn-binding protein involved in type VI secretion